MTWPETEPFVLKAGGWGKPVPYQLHPVVFDVFDTLGDKRLGYVKRLVGHAFCETCADCIICSHGDDGFCYDGSLPSMVVYEDDLLSGEIVHSEYAAADDEPNPVVVT